MCERNKIMANCLWSLHRALTIKSVTGGIVGDSIIRRTAVARNIGVMFDNELSLKSQVSKLCQVEFFYIRRIRSIRDCLTQYATELLIHSLVISRLDYGNGLLCGVSDQLLDKLKRVHNVAALVVVRASRYDHIGLTSILKTVHWLPIRYRTEYKLPVLDVSNLEWYHLPVILFDGTRRFSDHTPFSRVIIQSPLLISLIAWCIFSLFCLVMLGQRYTTPLVTVVCPVTNLHHMASLQSASSLNCPS